MLSGPEDWRRPRVWEKKVQGVHILLPQGMGKDVDINRKFWYIPKGLASAVQTGIAMTRFMSKDQAEVVRTWEECVDQQHLPNVMMFVPSWAGGKQWGEPGPEQL